MMFSSYLKAFSLPVFIFFPVPITPENLNLALIFLGFVDFSFFCYVHRKISIKF